MILDEELKELIEQAEIEKEKRIAFASGYRAGFNAAISHLEDDEDGDFLASLPDYRVRQ